MTKPLLLVEALAAGNDSGLGRHVRLFVHALAGLCAEADIRVVLPHGLNFSPPAGIRVIRVPARPYRIFCEVLWPALIAVLRPKVVLCLGQTLPKIRIKARYALLVPDAAPLESLPFLGSGHPEFNRDWMRQRVPKADILITSAEFTRRRLRELLGVAESRIFLVPPVEGWQSEPAPVIAPISQRPPYFLAVGNIEPRKNYPGLFRAYALARAKVEMPPLHILGHEAWDGGEARKVVESLGLGGRVFIHGHVTETERSEWLRHCRAFITPSLYEGFGLPLFEALRMGKACVFHGDSAQAEFASDCALSTDCSDPQSFAAAMVRLVSEESLLADLEGRAKHDFSNRWKNYNPGLALRIALLPLLTRP